MNKRIVVLVTCFLTMVLPNILVANVVTDANNCVSGSNVKSKTTNDGYQIPRYCFTNNCQYAVDVIFKYNFYVSSSRGVECTGSRLITINLGRSETLSLRNLPRGVKSSMSMCAQYDDHKIEELTGYENCYKSGQPRSCY